MIVLRSALFVSGLILALSICFMSVATAQDQTTPAFVAPDPAAAATTAGELEILTVPMTAGELSELALVWQEHIKSVLQEIALRKVSVVYDDRFVTQIARLRWPPDSIAFQQIQNLPLILVIDTSDLLRDATVLLHRLESNLTIVAAL